MGASFSRYFQSFCHDVCRVRACSGTPRAHAARSRALAARSRAHAVRHAKNLRHVIGSLVQRELREAVRDCRKRILCFLQSLRLASSAPPFTQGMQNCCFATYTSSVRGLPLRHLPQREGKTASPQNLNILIGETNDKISNDPPRRK